MYHWMISAEGRHECDLLHNDLITIHEVDPDLPNSVIEKQIAESWGD